MAERGARNDRDTQLAWQGAEAALVDAEHDIHGPAPGNRTALLGALKNTSDFAQGCGQAGAANGLGLCALAESGDPAWLVVDFTDSGANARTVALGTFTGRNFASGAAGIRPAQAPRYVIEPLPDPGHRDLSSVSYIYRITAMGFGPRQEIQTVAQTIYRN
jgi:type IV pilus assembly protein PilX